MASLTVSKILWKCSYICILRNALCNEFPSRINMTLTFDIYFFVWSGSCLINFKANADADEWKNENLIHSEFCVVIISKEMKLGDWITVCHRNAPERLDYWSL